MLHLINISETVVVMILEYSKKAQWNTENVTVTKLPSIYRFFYKSYVIVLYHY